MGGNSFRTRPQPRTELPAPLARALSEILRLARRRHETVFLVGGTVRDLLLGRPPLDLDLMVEGDAVGLAAAFAATAEARLTSHRRFTTASVHLANGWRVDLAAPRQESYLRGGILPVVAPATVTEDLSRRDFTINAMAWQWGPRGPGRILDPAGGRADLEAGSIRILHPASLVDDPTRAFRAVRLASRLRFRLARITARALRNCVEQGGPDLLTPARRGREVRLLAMEIDWPRCVSQADHAGLLSHQGRGLVPASLAACRRLERSLSSRPARDTLPVILACMAMAGKIIANASGLENLQLPGGMARRAGRILQEARELCRRLENNTGLADPAELADLAMDMDKDALLLAQACTLSGAQRLALARFRRRLQGIHLQITAGDLQAAGIPRGPELRRRLTETRRQCLAGQIRGRRAELAFALSPEALAARRQRGREV